MTLLTDPHDIGMYRLQVLLMRCKMEAKGAKFRINTCAQARKEFQIKTRSRQSVVDFLEDHIHNIKTTNTQVDCYGHIAPLPPLSTLISTPTRNTKPL